VKAVSNAEKAVSNNGKARSNERLLLDFCQTPKSMSEICAYLGLKDRYKIKKKYIDPLLGVSLQMTEPDSRNSPTQKYVVIKGKI